MRLRDAGQSRPRRSDQNTTVKTVRAEMAQIQVDKTTAKSIMTLEEVADYLRKSPSWVYKNWKVLGGVKLRGSLFFPSREDLYEHLFGRREGLPVRLHAERREVHESMVQNRSKGSISRGKKKGGNKKSKTADPGSDRHNLLGLGKHEA